MTMPSNTLPPDVLKALEQGNMIEAVKRLMASTGLNLTEAKRLIDQAQRGFSGSASQMTNVSGLPPTVAQALQKGKKIEAIRLLREHTGMGLKEAKEAVDASQPDEPHAGEPLAPGEVPRTSRPAIWLITVAALIALLAYYLVGTR